MQDAGARRHPLHITSTKRADVAQGIPVLDRAFQHIGDCFDPAVRVPREPFFEILRTFVAEIVEQQEGVQLGRVLKPESTVKLHACAFHRLLGRAGL